MSVFRTFPFESADGARWAITLDPAGTGTAKPIASGRYVFSGPDFEKRFTLNAEALAGMSRWHASRYAYVGIDTSVPPRTLDQILRS